MKPLPIKRGEPDKIYTVYENNQGDFVKVIFLSWDSQDRATHISVRSNFMKIKKAFFCAERDRLEIRGEEGKTSQPHIESLENCYINEEQVVLIIFKRDERKDYSHKCYLFSSDSEPETRKGRVIVGG